MNLNVGHCFCSSHASNVNLLNYVPFFVSDFLSPFVHRSVWVHVNSLSVRLLYGHLSFRNKIYCHEWNDFLFATATVNEHLTWINSRCHSTFRVIVSRIPNEWLQRFLPIERKASAQNTSEPDKNRKTEEKNRVAFIKFVCLVGFRWSWMMIVLWGVPLLNTNLIVLPEHRWWSRVAFVLLFRFRFVVYLF